MLSTTPTGPCEMGEGRQGLKSGAHVHFLYARSCTDGRLLDVINGCDLRGHDSHLKGYRGNLSAQNRPGKSATPNVNFKTEDEYFGQYDPPLPNE